MASSSLLMGFTHSICPKLKTGTISVSQQCREAMKGMLCLPPLVNIPHRPAFDPHRAAGFTHTAFYSVATGTWNPKKEPVSTHLKEKETDTFARLLLFLVSTIRNRLLRGYIPRLSNCYSGLQKTVDSDILDLGLNYLLFVANVKETFT